MLSPAESAAKQAQDKVNSCLDAGEFFRLEAGAGAGKTYSLVTALKRLIAERGDTYGRKAQQVACITYTNVAKLEILQEINEHPAVYVDTIHAFCWGFMSRFQAQLRHHLAHMERHKEKIAEAGGLGTKRIEYDLGYFGIDEARVTLYHDDVPELMAKLLSYPKFRQLLAAKHPVIFIDEYQDTDKTFMTAISQNVFAQKAPPLVSLFGDHWQTIYHDEFDLTAFPNVQGIDKGSNFRSVPAVVNVLNRLRPDLVQAVKDPTAPGEARVFHTNEYTGARTDDRSSKDDAPPEIARAFLKSLRERLEAEGWNFAPELTKVLMLTHSVLASEQGYASIVEVFKGSRSEGFAKLEDATLAFLSRTVEPMCTAYADKHYGAMFQVLGRAGAIKSHADKKSWMDDMATLNKLRLSGTIGEVLDLLKMTRRPRLPDPVARREEEMAAFDPAKGEEEKGSVSRHRRLREIKYAEVIELTKFVEGYTPFATQHSVKGAEFENVLVVLGGGWNHYNWPRMLDLLGSGKPIPDKSKKGFQRARNLFYVSISRPKRRLAVLFTQTVSGDGLKALTHLFGLENVCALPVPQITSSVP